jgi:prepilin-type N-terminal cleavage/methylation domain-containing protein
MDKKKAFTLIELLVVISVIVILLGILVPALGRAREFGRRTKCLSNLRLLQLAWIMYAENNDEDLVNGEIFRGEPGTNSSILNHIYGTPWNGCDYDSVPHNNEALDKNIQIQGIQAGTLYPFVGNVNAYHCPNGFHGFIRTYSIVATMNGDHRPSNPGGNDFDPSLLLLRISNRLDIKNPASQMVFIDIGLASVGSLLFPYAEESWRGWPPCQHVDGNTFSFADGHAEFWKWQGKETIENAISIDTGNIKATNLTPTTSGGLKDLHRTQIAIWGKLGYTPTPTE